MYGKLCLPTLTVINSHESADEAYALLKRKIFSWCQKDDSVSEWSRSDAGK